MIHTENSRGVRNNNPLNLRRTSDNWIGLCESQTDKEFFQFESPEYGFRAAAKTLMNYRLKGISTVSEVINRWAPPTENNTSSYIVSICSHLGVPPTYDITDDDLPMLLRAMAYIESGKWYDITVIQNGISLLKKT